MPDQQISLSTGGPVDERPVRVEVERGELAGDLVLPEDADDADDDAP